MIQLKESIEEIMNQIKETAELLYQQKYAGAYQKLDKLLIDFVDIIDNIYAYKKNGDLDTDSTGRLTEMLKVALCALENKDYVLLADVLQYDILAELKKEYQVIEEKMENE